MSTSATAEFLQLGAGYGVSRQAHGRRDLRGRHPRRWRHVPVGRSLEGPARPLRRVQHHEQGQALGHRGRGLRDQPRQHRRQGRSTRASRRSTCCRPSSRSTPATSSRSAPPASTSRSALLTRARSRSRSRWASPSRPPRRSSRSSDTTLADFSISNSSNAFIFSDFIPVDVGVLFRAAKDLDVGVLFQDDLKNAGDLYCSASWPATTSTSPR